VELAPIKSFHLTKPLGTPLAGAKAAPIDFAGDPNVRRTKEVCMPNRRKLLCLGAVGLWLIVPQVAQANAGLPMIYLVWPGMGLMLLPVVVLETFILRRALGTSLKRTLLIVVTANLISTALGIPLTWGVLVLLQLLTLGGSTGVDIDTLVGKLLAVTWQAPWLMPYDGHGHWMAPAAALTLLVPFFFASWFIEYFVSRRMVREVNRNLLKKMVRNANLASYLMLALVALGYLVAGIQRKAGI
jgi:hypothetical protein